MKAYPLRFSEKAPKGTKQGAKLPEVSKQGREIGVFLAFSHVPAVVGRIEQDLRRRTLYPGELRGHVFLHGRIFSIILRRQGKVKDKFCFRFYEKRVISPPARHTMNVSALYGRCYLWIRQIGTATLTTSFSPMRNTAPARDSAPWGPSENSSLQIPRLGIYYTGTIWNIGEISYD